jgi:hypothetical protein
VLAVAYVGPEADADRVLAPLLALGPGVMGSIDPPDHLESQHANDDAMGWGHRVYEERVPRP